MPAWLIRFGILDLLLPLVLWSALFVVVAVVAGLLVHRAFRRRLGARPAPVAIPLAVIVELVVLPLLSLPAGAVFSLYRSGGALIRKGGAVVVDYAVSEGLARAHAELRLGAEDTVLPVSELKARVAAALGGARAEGAGGFARRLFYWGLERGLTELGVRGDVRVSDLERLARSGLRQGGAALLGEAASPLDALAWKTLLLWLGLQVVAAVAFLTVAGRIARRPLPEPGAGPAAG